MEEFEIIGFTRLISFIAIIAAGFSYFAMNKLVGRISIAIAVLSLSLSIIYSYGLLLSIVYVVGILCLPIFIAPVMYVVQKFVVWKVERKYGAGSIGEELKIDWFGGYRIL